MTSPAAGRDLTTSPRGSEGNSRLGHGVERPGVERHSISLDVTDPSPQHHDANPAGAPTPQEAARQFPTSTPAQLSDGLPRRKILTSAAGAGGLAAAATVGLASSPVANAAGNYWRPGRWKHTPILSGSGRHLVGRFSYGITPHLTKQVRRAGGAEKWFRQQLYPGKVTENKKTRELRHWWPDLFYGPQKLWERNVEGTKGGWEVMSDYARREMNHRIHTNRQVHAVMKEFWENHLHVPVNGDGWFTWRAAYGEVFDKHALGRFDKMLADAITHPAMLIYLNAAGSTKKHPNENLARELLELHTVGVGNYSEADVQDAAKLLTGYTIDYWKTWAFGYEPGNHATGKVKVRGFTHNNAHADGRAALRELLSYLAHHPDTARRLAHKLAVKFVSDEPSADLVDHLAQVYLDSNTRIRPVLLALIGSEEFKKARYAKVRDPGEDVVATYRVLRVQVRQPTGEEQMANQMLWQTSAMGHKPYEWNTPDGPPSRNATWATPARALASLEMHWGMAGGWWPSEGGKFRSDASWLPARKLPFRALVDHLTRSLLGRSSTRKDLQAACKATGLTPGETITRDHALVQWQMHKLLASILDSPHHYTH